MIEGCCRAAGYTKAILRPRMVVAGDHANNDMAGEDADSWLSQFKASGAFDSIDCQIAGLGGIEDVQKAVCRPHQGGDRFSERLIKRTLSVPRPLRHPVEGVYFYLNNGIIKS